VERRAFLKSASALALTACVPAGAQNVSRSGRRTVIYDTDLGDDVDDAFALALLCAMPNVRILGVTTAFGETAKRAELAAKLLRVLGKGSVPIYIGRSGDHKIGRQYEWAKGYRSSSIRPEPAVEFIRREIERAPGAVTLLPVGPLTNIGDLLTRYPELKPKIREVVIMGGAVHSGYNEKGPPEPEWNIRCDPQAARVLFSSGVPIIMAGLESTTMMKLDLERQKRLFAFGTPATDALAALTILWGNGVPTLFDPVAVAWACGHAFAETEPVAIRVEDNGMTRLADGPKHVSLLVRPRRDAFLDWYVQAFAHRR
jgi:inosine-uridine nucleoside N-ribohydrolase